MNDKSPMTGLIASVVALQNATVANAQALADDYPLFGSTYARADLGYFDGAVRHARAVDVVFSDLDADGDVDAIFATTRVDNQYVSVLLNDGDGVFRDPVPYIVGAHPSGVTLGDVDGDGDPDLGVSNFEDGTVSIMLNAGDATFGEAVTYDVGDRPISLIAADLNQDGLDDLVVLNGESEDVSVLLSQGGGMFAPESRIFVDNVSPGEYFTRCPQLTSGDINADGHLDFAIPCRGDVKFLMGDGAGGLSLSPHVADVASTRAYDTVLTDFNLDGRVDLASIASGGGPTALSVVFQNADGSWPVPVTYSGDFYDCPGCFYTMFSLAEGDIDADGDLDLVVGEGTFENVGIYRNLGEGVFEGPELHFARDDSFNGPWVVELEDLNADGHLDLAYLDGSSNGALHIHMNDQSGGFLGPVPYNHTDDPDCTSGQHAHAADMDLDGFADIVMGHSAPSCLNLVSVHRNDGAGGFSTAASLKLDESDSDVYPLSVADLNADGLPDIVVPDKEASEQLPGRLHVIMNLGNFEFAPAESYPVPAKHLYWSAVADLDGDGDLDVAAYARGLHPGDNVTPIDHSIEVFLNEGDGTMVHASTSVFAELPRTNGSMEAGDLDGDGLADLVVNLGDGHGTFVLLNEGAGQFEVEQVIKNGPRPTGMVLGDFDCDGTVEVGVLFAHTPQVPEGYLEPYLIIYENDGDGHLSVDQTYVNPNVEVIWQIKGADVNADGHLDLVIPELPGALRVHLNLGNGTFDPGVSYGAVDFGTQGAAIADFDADGRVDIGVSGGDYVATLFGRACSSCPADVNADGSLNVLDFIAFQLLWQAADPAADCDADGVFDPLDFACFQGLFGAGCD